MNKTLSSRLIGYVGSLILTLATFFLVLNPSSFHPRTIVIIILVFAVLQAIVQAICFLHIWGETKPRWNVIFFLSTIAMILIILIGSIWIMDHLNANMMPPM